MRTKTAIIVLILIALFATACPVKPVPATPAPRPTTAKYVGPGVPAFGRFTTFFAWRSQDLRNCDAILVYYDDCKYHPYPAVDILMPVGTPIRAIASGRVVMADQEFDGEGDPESATTTTTTTTEAPIATTMPTTTSAPTTTTLPATTTTLEEVELTDIQPITAYERKPGMFIVLDHRAGNHGYRSVECSRYSHLDRMVVEVGQWVRRGTVIGYSGSTIAGGRPHLHLDGFFCSRWSDFGPNGGFNTYATQQSFTPTRQMCWEDSRGRRVGKWAQWFHMGETLDIKHSCGWNS